MAGEASLEYPAGPRRTDRGRRGCPPGRTPRWERKSPAWIGRQARCALAGFLGGGYAEQFI
jgi:hypothetical protein